MPSVPSKPARTRTSRSEHAADQFFNKFPRSFPYRSFDRIESIVEKLGSRFPSHCGDGIFVMLLVTAWSSIWRSNAGCFEVDHLGDNTTFNSNQSRDVRRGVRAQNGSWRGARERIAP
ncbi:hypothetical protein ACVWVY_004948 [Bradyrhizobium sp. URHC0002]